MEDVPAHITILYPFLPIDRLDVAVIDEIRAIISTQPVLSVRMTAFQRFPRLLYLDPRPSDWAAALTERVARGWPETPPYGGEYDPVPHITLAAGVDEAAMDLLESRLARHLPIETVLDEAWLVLHDGTGWRGHTRFPFAGAGTSAAGGDRARPGGLTSASASPVSG